VGPGACAAELTWISSHIGGALWEPEEHGRCAREKARLREGAARRTQSYLHVTQGYKPWVCYGKPTKYPPLGEGGVYIDALSSQSTPRKKKVLPETETRNLKLET
jgi:hypothetical protein